MLCPVINLDYFFTTSDDKLFYALCIFFAVIWVGVTLWISPITWNVAS
jgi:hypothetical protein